VTDENNNDTNNSSIGQDEPLLPMEMPVVFNTPKIGQVITSTVTGNTYRIGGLIGEGAFSFVFFCKDDWDNNLAAKVLKPVGDIETVRRRTIEEVSRLVHLRHPNITYAYDAFEYQNSFFIITEYCNNSMLSLVREPWFHGPAWVMPIARNLLQAVEYLHSNQMVHKDIHFGNVLTALSRNELGDNEINTVSFRLSDLGISNHINNIDPSNTFMAQWMLPPEYIRPDEFGPLDHRIDIYHCGLFFLQLLLNRELYFTNDEILAGCPRQLALRLPQPFRSALEKALRRHTMYRTSSAREMWRDLNSPAS